MSENVLSLTSFDVKRSDVTGVVQFLRELADAIESKESAQEYAELAFVLRIGDKVMDIDIGHYNSCHFRNLALFAWAQHYSASALADDSSPR